MILGEKLGLVFIDHGLGVLCQQNTEPWPFFMRCYKNQKRFRKWHLVLKKSLGIEHCLKMSSFVELPDEETTNQTHDYLYINLQYYFFTCCDRTIRLKQVVMLYFVSVNYKKSWKNYVFWYQLSYLFQLFIHEFQSFIHTFILS